MLPLCLLAAQVSLAASLDVYGKLPSLEDVALSPDGSRLAFVRTQGDARVIAIVAIAERKSAGGMRIGNQKLRLLEWADDDHLMIVTSETSLPPGFMGEDREWYLMQVFDLAGRKFLPVPDPAKLPDLRMMNVIGGRVMVRRLEGHTVLFVPGVCFSGGGESALFRFDLQTGREMLVRQGPPGTRWLVNEAGEVAAQQTYDERSQRWTIKIRRDERLQEIASGAEAIDVPLLLGYGPTSDTLLIQSIEGGDSVWRLMSVRDGTLGPPMAERKVLDAPFEDRLTYRMIGGVHVDDESHYVFFDSVQQALWNSIVDAFPGERVRFVSSSADFSKVVVRVDGPRHGYAYELVDLKTHRAQPVGNVYDGLTGVLEVRRITYAAADGLQIPAYLTLPRTQPSHDLPLIVLPHGGPAVRDTADFSWWAQALADQGYAVLQPNYRGSSLDRRFLAAGFGEWGRKMQTDLSDGVRYLVHEGIVDPARVCIVGASYGGYAALAGVTLDPGVYRCAISVAGLSDLKRMLERVNWNHLTGNNLEQRYWDRFMGVRGPGDPVLDAISPIKHLDRINVPVLLIHGLDDTVVPFEQSRIMFDALRRAGKNVELVTMKHEDHWLSRGETRLQMLRSMVAFLRAKNPPDEQISRN